MISFKTRADVLPSVLILLSLLILTAVSFYGVLYPPPSATAAITSRKANRLKMKNDVLFFQKREKESQAAITPRLWTGSTNHVISSVLALISDNSNAQSVKLTAFRPQRTQDLDGITELPFAVQLTGSYPAIRQVMRTLDSGSNKVVLRSVQVNASEEITNSVTATLVISTYMATPVGDETSEQSGGA